MGVTWIVDIISWSLREHEILAEILHCVDVLNCVQGVIIFFLFVWKPKVKKLLRRR
jgi:G protein-coupled receptor Mth (Methuselah protein)